MDRPQIETLMGAYYHEDFAGIWESLDLYINDSSTEERGILANEIAALLDEMTDDELDAYLEKLGSNVYLGDDPAAYRTWLEDIARRVASA